MPRIFAALMPASCLALLLAACASNPILPPQHTVAHIDLNRYMGRWYVIANIPYLLERGKVASIDEYGVGEDGWMTNNFIFRRGSLDAPEVTWHGKAKVTNTETNAEWKVQFIWPFTAPYMVIDLDPDYRWAVVGYPDRSLMWVLSRDTTLAAPIYQGIVARAAAQGYDTSKLTMIPQPLQPALP